MSGAGNSYGNYVFKGLDIVLGVRNVGGNVDEFNRIIKAFYYEAISDIKKLDSYVDEEPDLFRRLIHEFRCSFSTIGASDLSDKIVALDKKLIESNPAVKDEYARIREEMSTLIDEIGRYIRHLQEQDITRDLLEDKELCGIPGVPRELAAQLKEAIYSMDRNEILFCLASIRDKSYSRNIEVQMNKMEVALDQLDYNEAERILDDITEQI